MRHDVTGKSIISVARTAGRAVSTCMKPTANRRRYHSLHQVGRKRRDYRCVHRCRYLPQYPSPTTAPTPTQGNLAKTPRSLPLKGRDSYTIWWGKQRVKVCGTETEQGGQCHRSIGRTLSVRHHRDSRQGCALSIEIFKKVNTLVHSLTC